MSQLIKYVHKDNWLHWTFKIARLSDIACNCKSESIDHADQYLDSIVQKNFTEAKYLPLKSI